MINADASHPLSTLEANGRGAFTVKLRKKGTKRVRLPLTRAARKLVKRKKTRRIALAVTVRARDKAGNKRKKTLRKTLRR